MSVAVTASRRPSPPRTVHVVVPDGVDALARRRLQVQVRRAIACGAAEVVVEVGAAVALTSADVAALLRANRACTRRGGRMVVVAELGSDLGLLGSTCLRDAVTIADTTTRSA